MDKNHMKEIKRLLKLRAKAQEKQNLKEESMCCNVLGNEYLQMGDFDEALQMHKQELQLCEALQDPSGKAVANRKIGDVYCALENFELAIKHHKRHLELARDDDLELQRAHTSLGQTYLEHAKRLADVNKARNYFLKSINLLAESIRIATALKESSKVSVKEFSEMRIRSLINLGLCQHQLSLVHNKEEKLASATKCTQHFQTALYLAQKQSLDEEIYRARFILSAVNCDNKQFSDALLNAQTAMKIATKLGRVDLQEEAFEHCAQVHLLMENLQSAKHILKKLYRLQREGKERTREKFKAVLQMSLILKEISSASTEVSKLYKLHEALADIYVKNGCLLLALKNYKKQEMLLNDLPGCSVKNRADVYFSIASTLMDVAEYDDAVCYFKKEMQTGSDVGEHAKTWLQIALCKEKKGESYESVKKCVERASKCAEECGDERLLLKVLTQKQATEEYFKDFAARAETNKRIGGLELKLGILVDELENTEQLETSECDLGLDNETIETELAYLSEDNSEADDAPRRRKRLKQVRRNEKGETDLHKACIEGQLKRVELLLEQGHPVDPRDYADWTPLHEACNFGHREIVDLLLSKGADANAPGGGPEAVTPMHDAGFNGHFEIVSKLLQHGGDPNKVSGRGKTVLDILTSFYQQHKEDMDEEDRLMYKKLYAELKNMGTCPRPAPTTTNISPACTVTSGAVLLPEDLSDEDSPLRNERAVSPILCDPLPLLKRSGKRTTGSSGASLYRSSIAALGSSSSLSAFASTQKSGPKKPTRIPSLLADEDLCGDDNDWLVDDDDDLLPQAARKAKRPHAPKFAEPTRAAKSGGWRRQKTRVSESPPEAAAEIDVAFASSDYTEDIPALATPANPPLRPAPMNNPVLHQERSAFRLKVKVEDDVFNIAVPDKTKPISWLSERASSLFEKLNRLRPSLTLLTADGALLPADDLVCDVLNSDDLITARVESWQMYPLSQRYTTSCKSDGLPVIPRIFRACQECEGTSIMDVKHSAFGLDKFRPLFVNLGQEELSKLLLPGNRLGDDGVRFLSDSLLRPVSRSTLLTVLNLACNNITDAGIQTLARCDSVKSIACLNVSYNPIASGNGLKLLLRNCTRLTSLNVSTCYLSDATFANHDPAEEDRPSLISLDISGNAIGYRSLSKWLDLLSKSYVEKLKLDSILNLSASDKFIGALCKFLTNRRSKVTLIDLSKVKLSREDIESLRSVSQFVHKVIISAADDL